MEINVNSREDAIKAIKMLEKGFEIEHSAVWEEENKVPIAKSPVSYDMLRDLLCHLNTSSASLDAKWKKLSYQMKHSLVEKGCNIAKVAAKEGCHMCYRGNDEMAIYSMLKAVGFC